ncbi:hypothetical protein AgCh_008563 [Apium graveolens]
MADIAMLLAEEYEKMMKKRSAEDIEVFRKIEDGYSWIKVRFGGVDLSNNKVWGFNPKSQVGVAAISGIATVHPKCQTRPCPPNEDNPPDSRTGDPKLLGAKCRMTPKFSNEDTR